MSSAISISTTLFRKLQGIPETQYLSTLSIIALITYTPQILLFVIMYFIMWSLLNIFAAFLNGKFHGVRDHIPFEWSKKKITNNVSGIYNNL